VFGAALGALIFLFCGLDNPVSDGRGFWWGLERNKITEIMVFPQLTKQNKLVVYLFVEYVNKTNVAYDIKDCSGIQKLFYFSRAIVPKCCCPLVCSSFGHVVEKKCRACWHTQYTANAILLSNETDREAYVPCCRFAGVSDLNFHFERIVIDTNCRLRCFWRGDMSAKYGAIYLICGQNGFRSVGRSSSSILAGVRSFDDFRINFFHFVNLLQNSDASVKQYSDSRNKNQCINKLDNCVFLSSSAFSSLRLARPSTRIVSIRAEKSGWGLLGILLRLPSLLCPIMSAIWVLLSTEFPF
jgi:hypothetical protein